MTRKTMTYTEELVVHTCWCGMAHAIPRALSDSASRTGQGVYCPAGHSWVLKNSDMDRLKQQVAARTAELDQQRARADAAEAKATKLAADAARAKKRSSELAADAARAKQRASAGVCPCCNRTFQNVARHMKTQHPE